MGCLLLKTHERQVVLTFKGISCCLRPVFFVFCISPNVAKGASYLVGGCTTSSISCLFDWGLSSYPRFRFLLKKAFLFFFILL